jgi:chorismate lyase / 3-hydroxybenzoate synthase
MAAAGDQYRARRERGLMGSGTRLQVDYLTLPEPGSAQWEGVLGVVAFEDLPVSFDETDVPVAEINTPLLGAKAPVCEIWHTQRPVESGQRARVRYRRDESVLFGCISVPETAATPFSGESPRSALQAATEQAYREIFSVLDSVGYSHLLRVWNYLPEINADQYGSERYWQFNQARRDTLIACGRAVSGNVPAACALGSAVGSPLVIYFLASQSPPVAVENPRQTSAFQYPPKYGPRPVFARASVLRQASANLLFISGTASIVGHETFHIGDAAAQTRESLVNIEALLGEANRVAGAARFALGSLAYKVYVRRSSDLPVIQAQLSEAVGSSARIVYLKADICRQDLLVEIEATGVDYDPAGS